MTYARAARRAARALGFNRLSMGVQDFDPERAGGDQPHPDLRTARATLLGRRAALGFESINVDLIYGLPYQTRRELRPHARHGRRRCGPTASRSTRSRSCRGFARTEAASPDGPAAGPSASSSCSARRSTRSCGAGYRQIGMDHFALPDDELARRVATAAAAPQLHGLHRRSRRATWWPSASPASATCAARSCRTPRSCRTYYAGARRRPLPGRARLRARSRTIAIRRHVITELMCNFRVEIPHVGLPVRHRLRPVFRARAPGTGGRAGGRRVRGAVRHAHCRHADRPALRAQRLHGLRPVPAREDQ